MVCVQYAAGVVVLALGEVGYAAWMGVSLAAWWREAPQAALARRGMDLVHDLKPALLAVERYRDVALAVYDMIEETERAAPNNVVLILVFAFFGAILQVRSSVICFATSHYTDDILFDDRSNLGSSNYY